MSFYKICTRYQQTLHFQKLRTIHEILCTLDGAYEEQCEVMQDIYLSQNEIVGARHHLLLFQIVANTLNNITSWK